jgi:hypothetical protein
MESDISQFPVGKRLLADPGFSQDGRIGGQVPVVVECLIDGYFAYFRSRGSHWSCVFTAEYMDDPAPADELFKVEGFWASWPHAGYMPLEKALELFEKVIVAFRATRLISPDFPDPLPTSQWKVR